ncbi:MAG: peptidyl-prolyl cis-trans isomerase [Candidatus Hydrogenedentota bacterium]
MRYFPLVVCSILIAPFASAEIVDAIVATVDDEPILYSDVLMEAGPAMRDLRTAIASEEEFNQEADRVMRETLEQHIDQKLLVRQAQIFGAEVTDKDIDASMQDLRQQLGTNEAFMKELEATGMTMAEFRDRRRLQILAARMAYSKVRDFEEAVIVSEDDVQKYYADNQDVFTKKERALVRQIFLPAASGEAERAAARARMEIVLEELEAGTAFEDLAKAYSEGPGKEDGGLVGWEERGELVPVLEEAAFALEAGGHTGAIESEFGVHVLKVDKREEAGVAPIDEVRTEIEPQLRNGVAQERYKSWLAELRKSSRVRVFM